MLLTLQNSDGGWATYENNRGYGWYEWLNPSEVFGDIMIDYSYVECSMASLSALYAFRAAYPHHRRREVDHAIRRGRSFIKSIQRPDGSWYGSWGCCFTYGTWFGVEGLVLSGEPADSDHLRRACAFLLGKQNANGGWGEDFTSCYNKAYAREGMERFGSGGSGVVNTAWALLALLAANCDDAEALRRGAAYLMSEQLPNGDWKQEGIAGVFNRACGISYTQACLASWQAAGAAPRLLSLSTYRCGRTMRDARRPYGQRHATVLCAVPQHLPNVGARTLRAARRDRDRRRRESPKYFLTALASNRKPSDKKPPSRSSEHKAYDDDWNERK